MKRFATLALAAALASAGAMASAQDIKPAEPVVSTQGLAIPTIAIIGGLAVLVIIAAADSSDGT